MRSLSIALVLTLLAPLPVLTAEPSALPGTWVSVKGRFGPDGRLLAREVEHLAEPETSLKGPLDALDGDGAGFGTARFAVDRGTRYRDASGAEAEPASFPLPVRALQLAEQAVCAGVTSLTGRPGRSRSHSKP